MCLLTPVDIISAKTNVKNETVNENDHYSDWLFGVSKGDKIDIDVTSTGNIDIYIISNNQYWSGYLGIYSNFTPTFQMLNVTTAHFSWTKPDDQSYCLVIDNRVNDIEGSANPVGPVTISLTRSDPFSENVQAAGEALSFFCLAVIVILIVIVVLIIVGIVIYVKRKSQKTPPLQPYPQQQYYQQQPQYVPVQYPPQYPQQPPQPPYYPPQGR